MDGLPGKKLETMTQTLETAHCTHKYFIFHLRYFVIDPSQEKFTGISAVQGGNK